VNCGAIYWAEKTDTCPLCGAQKKAEGELPALDEVTRDIPPPEDNYCDWTCANCGVAYTGTPDSPCPGCGVIPEDELPAR